MLSKKSNDRSSPSVPMAPGKHDEIRELLAPGDGGVVELSTERLEQLYLEVAPQVRQRSQARPSHRISF